VKSLSTVTAAAAAAMYSVQESSSNGKRMNYYVPLEDDETQPFEKKCAK